MDNKLLPNDNINDVRNINKKTQTEKRLKNE